MPLGKIFTTLLTSNVGLKNLTANNLARKALSKRCVLWLSSHSLSRRGIFLSDGYEETNLSMFGLRR